MSRAVSWIELASGDGLQKAQLPHVWLLFIIHGSFFILAEYARLTGVVAREAGDTTIFKKEDVMKAIILVLMIVLVYPCLCYPAPTSNEIMVTEDSMEANQTGSEECMAGTLYMQSLCSIADGDTDKCLNLMFLYGIPCLIFGSIMGDAEINEGTCLVGYFSISTVCLSCNGDVLKCLGLTLSTFYFPCLSRAWSGDNESVSE